MPAPEDANRIEQQIEHWRRFVRGRRAQPSGDEQVLEDGLRAEAGALVSAGLRVEEAFLIALRRIGERDTASGDLAREHSEQFWTRRAASAGAEAPERREGAVAVALALGAALAVKVPELFGLRFGEHEEFYARNIGLFVFPLLAAYFAWKRGAAPATLAGIAAGFAAGALFANLYARWAFPQELTALHVPIALWLLVGIAYAGGRWRDTGVRMDFIRFSGELFVYYVLIALGGVVLTGFMLALFEAIGVDMQPFFVRWLLPCGALGAVVIGAWLVEAKQRVMESLAPMLTRVFTPLFTLVLIAFLATMALTGRGFDAQRNVLIACDLLLVVVLGLHVYAVSARDPRQPPGVFDVLQVVLVVAALLVDAFALWAIASRISEFGFTPNRVTALGENVILLVNLAWSAALYVRFLRRHVAFAALERWQTAYLPVYAGWAAIVVAVFPVLFRG